MSRKIKYSKGEKKKQRWNLRVGTMENANRLLGSRIEMFSNREISVEGCEGVLEYNDCYLKLNLNKGALIIFGSEMDITAFEGRSITVSGKISSIEFCV